MLRQDQSESINVTCLGLPKCLQVHATYLFVYLTCLYITIMDSSSWTSLFALQDALYPFSLDSPLCATRISYTPGLAPLPYRRSYTQNAFQNSTVQNHVLFASFTSHVQGSNTSQEIRHGNHIKQPTESSSSAV